MNNTEFNTEKQGGPKRLSLWLLISAIAAITGLSALTALGFGGLPAFSISGAILAFLICKEKNPVPAVSAVTSFAAAWLISGSPLSAAAVLLFVPAGLALAYTALSRRSLSVTVVTVSVILLASMAAYLTVSVTELYGESITESYRSFGSDMKDMVYEVFSAFRYADAEGNEVFALSEEDIGKVLDTFVMLLPATCVITCQLIAYGAARLTQLLCSILGPEDLFAGRAYAVTLSAPAAAIFVVSYLISFFAREASVASYAALNLTYILLPFCAVEGFHRLFSKNGIFRGKLPLRTRIIFIVTCGVCVLLSPLSFIPLLAVFGSFGALGRAVGAFIKSRNEKHGDGE